MASGIGTEKGDGLISSKWKPEEARKSEKSSLLVSALQGTAIVADHEYDNIK